MLALLSIKLMFVTSFLSDSGRILIYAFLLLARPNCSVVNVLLYMKCVLFKPIVICTITDDNNNDDRVIVAHYIFVVLVCLVTWAKGLHVSRRHLHIVFF